jgi:alkanesulfonate monooxygenase SsuD/methylene tetrahydromethanopterin reductase-like flavin-dependent oxidoreductase (luciferase family)
VGIGFIVLNSTFRNPVLSAKVAATRDAVGGGRLTLGLGAGSSARRQVRRPALSVTRRATDNARRALSDYQPHDDLRGGATDIPRPLRTAEWRRQSPHGVQRPHIPLLIGRHGPKHTFRIAARYCDEISINLRPSEIPLALDQFSERCTEIGRDPATPQFCGQHPAQLAVRRTQVDGRTAIARQEDLTSAGMMTDLATLPSRAEELLAWRDLAAARRMCGIPGLANTDETMYEFVDDCRTAGSDL